MAKEKAKKESEEKIQFYSEQTRKFYQLFPTATAPTLKISGVPMHRYIHVDPLTDTRLKIKALRPFGFVLDTCTGLGYTAIEAAKRPEVRKVLTVEKDANVIKMARMNSWSAALFESPKIQLIEGDVFNKIKSFQDSCFDCVIHDPPTFALAPELYSLAFYQQLCRVLKHAGRLWHYCPEPGKLKGKGKQLKQLIIKNLMQAGFRKIKEDERSSGIIAEK